MDIKEKIRSLARQYHNDTVEMRRNFHKIPELSFQESETAQMICSELDKLKIPYKTGYAGNGIIADIKGKQGKRMIALRADMDALPVHEKNTFHYKSVHEGRMHACGHDAHIATLLGVARILMELRDQWKGKVRLVFQPAEEKIPGGAKQMLSDGIFSDKAPDFVIAQHVDPALETGKAGIKPGIYMASTDEIYITVKGTGGHAALPHKITDTVLAAAQIIVSMQQIVSRIATPSIPTVLSFGKIIANGATNIIPNEVKIEGTFRTFNEAWRTEAHARIRKIAEEVAASMNTECEIEILKGYPFLVNNENLAGKFMESAGEFLGKENVEELDMRMTAEDFSYFSQKFPSIMYRLGTGNVLKGIVSPLHSDTFNIDENALIYGTGLMTYQVIKLLG